MRRIYESILLLCKEQKGAVKILVALSMVMLIGFTAFVVDVGSLYYEKSSLQKSLDAAVLGGAQLLKESKSEATAVAIDLASQNGFTVSTSEVKTGANFVEIKKTVNKDLFFAKVLGFNQTDVSAFARAELNTLINTEGAIPLIFERKVLEEGVYGQEYMMHETASIRGNFAFLRIVKGGEVAKNIKDGVSLEVGEKEETDPGNISTKVREAFQGRIDDDNNDSERKARCNNHTTADNACRRIVTVALVETLEGLKGTSEEIEIIGFAVFWLESTDKIKGKDQVVGRFIEFLIDEKYGQSEGYGKTKVKLVE